MIGWNSYGLREAKKIIRHVREEVKGERDSYAKGFRAALRHCEQDINQQLDALKNLKE